MAALALPHFSSIMAEVKLNSDARKIAGVLRTARAEAIASGESQQVIFYVNDSQNPHYKYFGKTVYPLSSGVRFVSSHPFSSEYNNQPACIFKPTGSAVQGGTVSLKAVNKIKYVIVLNTTGRIRVSDTPPESWEK